ncbi:MAG: hypothetical protein UZ22_OP11002000773 [Microgenomates bacterium OLB23]|nr:MAG: hypothetical protein UZ22_OP11002000773 [Microgenomates bacterium OLB23]
MGAETRKHIVETDPRITKQGVIAIILRPSDSKDGSYTYYLLDHNGYSHTEVDGRKTVVGGIGLLSETMHNGESPEDYLTVLARGYVEEIMGISPETGTSSESFNNLVSQTKESMRTNLREIGSFLHDFNYHDRNHYADDPDTRGHVHVFLDDHAVMDIGDINQEEVTFAGYLGSGVDGIDHPRAHFRSGYDTRLLLNSPELQDILIEHCITIET